MSKIKILMDRLNIHPRILAALKRARVTDIGYILSLSAADLQRLTRLSANDIASLHAAAAETITKPSTVTALQILRHENAAELERHFLSIGCPVLDEFLRGGIMCPGVTEIAGESASGKTQFCLQLCLTAQLPVDDGGLDSGAVYICTEDAFPNRRLVQMVTLLRRRCPSVGTSDRCFTDRIYIEHAADADDMLHCISHKVKTLLAAGRVRLVIVDSIAGIFRAGDDADRPTGGDYYARRARQLSSLATHLHRLSAEYCAPVVIVNQVTDVFSGSKSGQHGSGSKTPTLGLCWANAVTARLMLSRTQQYVTITASGMRPASAAAEEPTGLADEADLSVPAGSYQANVRTIEVLFAPHLPNYFCRFIVDQDGVKGFK